VLHGVSKQARKLHNCSLQNGSLYRYRSCAARNCFMAVIRRATLYRTSSDKTTFMSWVFYNVPFCDRRAISFTKSINFNFICHINSAYGSETQISPPYLRAKRHSIKSDIDSVSSDRTLPEGHVYLATACTLCEHKRTRNEDGKNTTVCWFIL
jgi:hypothetical protein